MKNEQHEARVALEFAIEGIKIAARKKAASDADLLEARALHMQAAAVEIRAGIANDEAEKGVHDALREHHEAQKRLAEITNRPTTPSTEKEN